MKITAGIDVGSRYTKAALLAGGDRLLATGLTPTGFRLAAAAEQAYREALARAGLGERDVAYVVTTGYGRTQVPFRDLQVTDLTAQARGARFLFPGTRTVLDVGGQTMKAIRLDDRGRVRSFRLNDKCAAGTGAFLEKTARYLGFDIEEIGPLVDASTEPVAISGVCAVFAESEVINHVTAGRDPADILHGAIVSLVERSVQLMRRVGLEPEFTLLGGILRFATMARVVQEQLRTAVNVPPESLVQYTGAIGAGVLAARRLERLAADGPRVAGFAGAAG